MRTRSLQRPNRSEGPCVFAQRNQGLEEHKVPPAYSHAEESARALYGRRDDDLSRLGRFVSSHAHSSAHILFDPFGPTSQPSLSRSAGSRRVNAQVSSAS